MTYSRQIKTPYLLTGGEVLIKDHARDAHGSEAMYWNHTDRDGKTIRFLADRGMGSEDKYYLKSLREREVQIKADILGKGYIAVLPDGREINRKMVSFSPVHPELVKHNLSYLAFPNRDVAISLLKNEEVVVNYQPEEPINNTSKKIKP